MTSRTYAAGRNALVALGLWWSFTFLGGLVVLAWNRVFVFNRVFTGQTGDFLRVGLSLPGYIVVGVLVGLGAARFIESPRVLAWAAGLAVLIALADLKSWGGMRYRGRSLAEGSVVALVIVASIVVGCWLGIRVWGSGRQDRGQAA